MTKLDTIKRLLQRLSEIADWRFAVGVRIRFANPTLLYRTYPRAWIDYYDKEGLVFIDPTVGWAIANTGICDWSDLVAQDKGNVFGRAAEHGLKFGKAVSIGESNARTFGFFSHALREIEQSEIKEARDVLEQIHQATEGIEALSDQELSSLRALNYSLRRD
ncbi:autoinducer binding domain-containing protein [Pseudorhodobacter sp. W20_MBD10_FR17]|uniref:autoinducer binding domain-containing protein n=1 Tax=Pseudorhodobacter sp. W20_MBD10_FR17 TaxID=3240266 RepID=UPI003F9C2C6D